MDSASPYTLVGSRQFHVDYVENGVNCSFDITLDKEALDALAGDETVLYWVPSAENPSQHVQVKLHSQEEREYQVVQNLVRQAFVQYQQQQTQKVKGNIELKLTVGKQDIAALTAGQGVQVDVVDGRGVGAGFRNVRMIVGGEVGADRGERMRVEETTNHRVLLEQLQARPLFTGRFAAVKKALHPLLTRVGRKFRSIENWWNKITHQREMSWNMAMLGRVCSIDVEPPEVPLADGLHYMARLTTSTDQRLSKQLYKGYRCGAALAKLAVRKADGKLDVDKEYSKITALSRKIVKSLDVVPGSSDRAFVPIVLDDCQVLMAISKQTDGTYSVDLLDDRGDNMLKVEGLNEAQLTRAVEEAALAQLQEAQFDDLIDYCGDAGIAFLDSGVQGAGSMIDTIQAVTRQKLSAGDSVFADDHLETTMELRLFIDACQASDEWLKEPQFHSQVRQRCFEILEEWNQSFAGVNRVTDRHLMAEYTAVIGDVRAILDRTERVLPNERQITDGKFDRLGGSHFPEADGLVPAVDQGVAKALEPDIHLRQQLAAGASTLPDIPVPKDHLPEALQAEMKMAVTYADRSGRSVWDVDGVKQWERSQRFPQIEALPLTNEEKIALIWTLHSQESQMHQASSLDSAEAGRLARAFFTLKALSDKPGLGRCPEAQEWLLKQIEERITPAFLQNHQNVAMVRAMMEDYHQKAVDLLETTPRSSRYAENLEMGLFLLRALRELKAKDETLFGDIDDGRDQIAEMVSLQCRNKSTETARNGQQAFLAEYLYLLNADLKAGRDPLSPNELGTALAALARLEIAQVGNPRLKQVAEGLRLYLFAEAKKLEGADQSALGQQFCTMAAGQTAVGAEVQWQFDAASFPILNGINAEGQPVQLDLVAAEYYAGGRRAGRLPMQLQFNRDVIRLFPNALRMDWEVRAPEDASQAGTTIYVAPHDPNLRIVVSAGDTDAVDALSDLAKALQAVIPEDEVQLPAALQAQLRHAQTHGVTVDDGKDTYTRAEVISLLNRVRRRRDELSSVVSIERRVETETGDEWAVYHYFKAQAAIAHGRPVTGDDADMDPFVVDAIGQRSCWQSRSQEAVYVFQGATSELFGTYRQDAAGQVTFTKRDGSVLLEPNADVMEQVTNIEAASKTILYGEVGQGVTAVEFPELWIAGTSIPMSYTVRTDGDKAQLVGQDGWQLAHHRKRPGRTTEERMEGQLPPTLPPGFTGFHLLERGSSQKVMIPGRKLQRLPSTTMGYVCSKALSPGSSQRSKLYSFSVDPETNRLVGDSAESNLYLAYLSLVHEDHAGISYYLNKSRTGLSDTEGMQEIFSWIAAEGPATPDAQAMQLRLLCFAQSMCSEATLTHKQKKAGERARIEEEMGAPSAVHPRSGPIDDYSAQIQTLAAAIDTARLRSELHPTHKDAKIMASAGVAASVISALVPDAAAAPAALAEVDPSQVSALGVARPAGFVTGERREVMGRSEFASVEDKFNARQRLDMDAPEVEFFDRLGSSPSRAVQRVAGEHQRDLDEAVKVMRASEEATIGRDDAQDVCKRCQVILRNAEQRKLVAAQRALAILEVRTGAGREAVQRELGQAEAPTVQRAIQLFVGGDLRTPYGRSQLEALAKRKLSDAEIDELEWQLMNHMAAEADLRHMGRVIEAGEEYIGSCGKGAMGNADLAERFYDLVKTRRAFALYTEGVEISWDDAVNMCAASEEIRAVMLKQMNTLIPKDCDHKLFTRGLDSLFDTIAKHGRIADDRAQENTAEIARIFASLETEKGASKLGLNAQQGAELLRALKQIMTSDPNVRQKVAAIANDPFAREMLALEYSFGFILTENQTDTFKEMLEDCNNVRQLGMGGGKSKVLLPLLAKRKATGHNLVTLLLPEELYETNRRDLDGTNRELFGQEMFCFEFSRSADLDADDLEAIYQKMVATIEEKGFIASTRSSLLSFRDCFIDLATAPQEADIPKIQAMARILKLMEQRMDVLADEVDSVLDVQKEVNFAIGDWEHVNELKTRVGFDLMGILLGAGDKGEELQMLAQAVGSNAQASVPESVREEALRQWAGLYFDQRMEAWELPIEQREPFIEYVTGDPSCTVMPPYMTLFGQPDAQESDKAIFQEIAAVKAFMGRGFGLSMARTNLKDYGRDPRAGEVLTIPYKAANTAAIGSEFDDDIQRVAYALQDYAWASVSEEQVTAAVSGLLFQAQQQAKREGIPFAETDAVATFRNLAQKINRYQTDGARISENMMNYVDDMEGIAQFAKIVNRSPVAKLAFCELYVLNMKMRVFPEQVSSKAEDLVDMVHGFSGFTGTPWNRHTFHPKINAERNFGVDGRTYALLLTQQTQVRTISYDPDAPARSLADQLQFGPNARYQALVDTGAYLRGVTNEQFIRMAMEGKQPPAVGIYFDESGKIVGRLPNGEIIPQSKLSPENLKHRVTLYDQGHTVGADIKQDPKAVAAVTVGAGTSTRDLFQAVWRLRQLHKEQRVEIVVSEPVKALIMGNRPGEPTIEDILAFCLENESEKEAEHNFRAEAERIKGHGARALFSDLVDYCAEIPDSGAGQLANLRGFSGPVRDLMIKTRSEEESFVDYAAVAREENPQDVLDRMKAGAQAKLNAVAEEADVAPRLARVLQKACGEIEALGQRSADLYPETVAVGAEAVGGEQEAEAEAQTELNVELEVEAQQYEEEVVDVEEAPVADLGGSTQVAAKAMTHQDISGVCSAATGPDFTRAVNAVRSTGGSMPAACRQLQNVIPVFDPRIVIAPNYEGRLSDPAYDQKATGAEARVEELGNRASATFARTQVLLHPERLPLNQALFVRQNGEWTVVFGNQHDAYPFLSSYPTDVAGGNPAALIALGSNTHLISLRKNDAFDLDAMEPAERQQFMRLYAQLRFLRGETHYTEEELGALETWFTEQGAGNMQRFFENGIRPTRRGRDQLGYKDSPLQKLFERMTEEA